MDTGPGLHRIGRSGEGEMPDEPEVSREPADHDRELGSGLERSNGRAGVRRPAEPAPGLDDLDRGIDGEGEPAEPERPFRERELRPPGRLRLWQTLPIGALAILGALMFAFPLAFESSGGGVVVGMLGLLLFAAACGWGAAAAYRAGFALPGLPRVGSGARPGWRALLGYTCVGVVVLALAVWRVARLRG
ncbi:hypothetical protein [Phaeacidiphilus oryzae]|jgi:hypothetical protein|uniref:hypothetical protein n=1 Tax=Phaeacidiphilus oryzae TaxID=348818 RepID=UPI000A4E5311